MLIKKLNTIQTKILLSLAFLFFCPEIFAAVFDVVPTDKSRQYLGTIFGGNLGVVQLGGATNPLLAKMFEKFNFIIVTVGSIVVSYIGIISVINTAREGEALGKKISGWIILRAFIGMMLMVPTPASGYSMIQITVMWVVLNGIGAANTVWNVVLTQLSSGVQAIGTSSALLGINDIKLNNDALKTSLVGSVLSSSICAQTLNTLANGTPATNTYGPIKLIRQNTDNPKIQILSVGVDAPNLTNICGQYKITTTANDNNINDRLNIKVNALTSMFDTLNPAAVFIVDNPSAAVPGGYFEASTNAFRTQMMQLSTNFNQPIDSSLSSTIEDIKRIGWIHAGNYYFSLTNSVKTNIDEDAHTIPAPEVEVKGTSSWTYSDTDAGRKPANLTNSYLITQLKGNSTAQYIQNVTKLNDALNAGTSYLNTNNRPIAGIPNLITNSPGTGNDILDQIVSIFADPITKLLIDFLQSQTTSAEDPIVGLARFGWGLMVAAEIAGITMIGLSFALALAASPMMCMSPASPPVVLLLIEASLVIIGLLIMLWTAGAALNLYLPMVPYLIFTSTAFGWFMAVIELVVGAPIMALGLVHPSDGELGKLSTGLGIIGNVFLRPTLMIFGFLLAASMAKAGIKLVNFGFIPAVTGKPPISTIFSFLAVLMMYMMFVIAIINKAFSLIYELPNQILRYMGGPTERHSSPEELVKEAKSGFDKGSEAGSKMLGKGLEKATKKLEETREKKAEEQLKAAKAKSDAEFDDSGVDLEATGLNPLHHQSQGIKRGARGPGGGLQPPTEDELGLSPIDDSVQPKTPSSGKAKSTTQSSDNTLPPPPPPDNEDPPLPPPEGT